MENMIILLVGRSGSGKSAIAKELEKRGLKQIPSFTTRPMRIGEINGKDHLFITSDEYMKYKTNNQISASTYFNGNYYGVTKDMIYNYDVYVVDKNGLIELQNTMPDIDIVSFYIQTPLITLIKRMLKRGDSMLNVVSRLYNDFFMFQGAKSKCKYTVKNNHLGTCVDEIMSIITQKESEVI